MKRIIFSSYGNYDKSAPAGTEVAVHETAKRLKEKYSITVVTTKDDGNKDKVIDGISYRHIGISFGGAKLKQIVYLLVLPFYAFFLEYDLWVEAFSGPISTAFLPLFTRRPVIGVTHFFNGDEMRNKYGLPFDLVEKVGLRTYKHIVALSDMQREKAERLHPHMDIRVIPNGINASLLALLRKPEELILYMGRIDVHSKGLDKLFEAYRRVIEKTPSVRLHFAGVGDPSDETALREKTNEHGLQDRISFLGHLSGAEKEDILSRAAVFVHASRFETFGISILEAMAAGIPTVVFDIPGLRWIPYDCIVKVPAYDTEKYALALIQLLSDEKRREVLGRRAQELASGFTWEAVAIEYDAFICSILDTNK